jgi:hypothetical protein
MEGYLMRGDGPQAPALRISPTVRHRLSQKNRVTYVREGAGPTGPREIPEGVVLWRWKQRTRAGLQFDGTRLHPRLWQTLPVVLGGDPAEWMTVSTDTIEDRLAEAHADGRLPGLKWLPRAPQLRALLQVCGRKRLASLVTRHAADPTHFGVPDLFLYAVAEATGRAERAVFVEVKKPEEPAGTHQKDELAALRALGLAARVFRLCEAGGRGRS